MSDFVASLLNLCLFPFDKTDNPVVFVPTFTLVFCFCIGLVSRFIRGKYR